MDTLSDMNRGPNTALVVLSFLQADCRSSEYREELLSLGQIINNKSCIQSFDDGGFETDGHLPSKVSLSDIHPSVELLGLRNPVEAEAIQEIAGELRHIGDLLEHNVVARATQNLSRNILDSSPEHWKNHLTREVERVMREGVGLEHLPQERVIMALTLTLVKRVCEQTPSLLRILFNTTIQYIMALRAR
ncbi:BH3 interacting domain death agonist [Parambassis ranga]|uniref:BH3-interacting domain death agonist n=1 Tax=Parambassis ranga TaxID=210632 RepID=A0A6P7I6S5_9TELE|nr:BH3-interacting domain death agonist-like [Parambassis ranga]